MAGHWERTCVPLELEMHSLHRARRLPEPRGPGRPRRGGPRIRPVLARMLGVLRPWRR